MTYITIPLIHGIKYSVKCYDMYSTLIKSRERNRKYRKDFVEIERLKINFLVEDQLKIALIYILHS